MPILNCARCGYKQNVLVISKPTSQRRRSASIYTPTWATFGTIMAQLGTEQENGEKEMCSRMEKMLLKTAYPTASAVFSWFFRRKMYKGLKQKRAECRAKTGSRP